MRNNILDLTNLISEETPIFDLACIGTSLCNPYAITLDSTRYLASADVVFAYPVSSSHLNFLKKINQNTIDLNDSFYKDGNDFKVSYTNIIEYVLNIVKSGKNVVYCCQGSPVFLSYTSRQLFKLALKNGLRAVMLPGISSFECILTTLAGTEDIYDVQIYNCDSLVNDKVTININSHCLLFNLTTYANSKISKELNMLETDKLLALNKALHKIYNYNHAIKILMLNLDGTCSIKNSDFNNMVNDLKTVSPGVTLLLPPKTY